MLEEGCGDLAPPGIADTDEEHHGSVGEDQAVRPHEVQAVAHEALGQDRQVVGHRLAALDHGRVVGIAFGCTPLDRLQRKEADEFWSELQRHLSHNIALFELAGDHGHDDLSGDGVA